MPVPTQEQYIKMLDTAKEQGYAYPAINVTTIEVINGALKAFAEAKSDGIIQISLGGGQFASGTAVKEAMDFYKIDPSHLIVISDDIAQKPGKIRVRAKGSSGGQKGLGDIIYQLGRDDFPRIRLGVGEKPHPDYDLADWVVSEFNKQEQELMFAAFPYAYEGLCKLLQGDMEMAQRICNSYSPEEKKA